MSDQPNTPPQPTKSMRPFDVLIGQWDTVGTHPALPSAVHGRSTFEWLRDGALLVWRFEWEPSAIPSAYSVIGLDDAAEACTMLYSDVRGVSRIYRMSMDGGVWKMWRDTPDFSQRMTGTFSDDGKTITVHGELSKVGGAWEGDLDVTYTRK